MERRKYLKVIGLFGVAVLMPIKMLGEVLGGLDDVCKQAWVQLSKFNATRYQFRYIEPTIGLPKVFLYGDSISIGYTEYVRASLEGKADVMRLHVNGSSSNRLIKNMESFRKALFQPSLKEGWDFSWDVIHFNVGLHDLKYLHNGKLDKVNGQQVSSVELYKKNLNNIIKYLKNTYPKAKLIFATTTPVPDGEPGRFEGDAKRYNKVALKVLKKHKDIIVNDLYSFSIPVWETYGNGRGDVHYQAEGSRLQGIEVAEVIANTLNVKTNDCPSTEVVIAKFKEYESNDIKYND